MLFNYLIKNNDKNVFLLIIFYYVKLYFRRLMVYVLLKIVKGYWYNNYLKISFGY